MVLDFLQPPPLSDFQIQERRRKAALAMLYAAGTKAIESEVQNLLYQITEPFRAAYSVRRVNGAYTGSLLDVRRSSDNDVLSVGYDDSTNLLNTSALTSFVGSNDGFVTRIYQQTGATGEDAIQSTTTAQGKIVNAGTLVTGSNGLPGILFDGTDDRYAIADFGGSQVFHTASVFQTSSTATQKILSRRNGATQINYQVSVTNSASNTFPTLTVRDSNGFEFANHPTAVTLNTRAVIESGVNTAGNQAYIYLNNSFGENEVIEGPLDIGAAVNPITIGRDANDGSSPCAGILQEMIIWYADLQNNRTALYNDIAAYFA